MAPSGMLSSLALALAHAVDLAWYVIMLRTDTTMHCTPSSTPSHLAALFHSHVFNMVEASSCVSVAISSARDGDLARQSEYSTPHARSIATVRVERPGSGTCTAVGTAAADAASAPGSPAGSELVVVPALASNSNTFNNTRTPVAI